MYREEVSSQIPAVRLLRAMGWEYLPAAEALQQCWLFGNHFRDVAEMVPFPPREIARP
jgi:hypothetical protein